MKLLQVKNWAQFQHYGNRNPIWIKVYLSLLDDYDFSKLTDAEAGQLVKVWLFAAKSKVKGTIPYDAEWVAKQVNATGPLDLDRFVDLGWLADEDTPENALARSGNTALAQSEGYPDEGASLEEKRVEEKRGEGNHTTQRPDVLHWEEFVAEIDEPVLMDGLTESLRRVDRPDALRRTMVSLWKAIGGGPSYHPSIIAKAVDELKVITPAGLRSFCENLTRNRTAAISKAETPGQKILRMAAEQDAAA